MGILVVDGFQSRVVLGVGDVCVGVKVESDEKKKQGFIL